MAYAREQRLVSRGKPLSAEQIALARILARRGENQKTIAERIYASVSAVQNRWRQIMSEETTA